MNSPANWTHPAAMEETQLLRECELLHRRTRGPGGQHRNKVSSGVEIRHTATGLIGSATERREQSQNHRVAMHRLRVNLALEVRQIVDPKQAPIALWQARITTPHAAPMPRLTEDEQLSLLRAASLGGVRPPAARGRIAVNVLHSDFPILLAYALDVLESCGYDLGPAAVWLKISPSQLIKFLALEPKAMEKVNKQRELRGLRKLKSGD